MMDLESPSTEEMANLLGQVEGVLRVRIVK